MRIFLCKTEKQKGLGHAISSARQFIGNEPFAVLLGDDIVESEVPAVKQLIDVYEETGTLSYRCPRSSGTDSSLWNY